MFLYTVTITKLNQLKLFAKYWNQNTMETVEITIAKIPGSGSDPLLLTLV